VVLTAADGAGNTGTSTLSVTVQDITPPSVNFDWSYVDSNGDTISRAAIEGTEITFSADNTFDNSGLPLTYEWDFSDGTNKQGKEVTHTFENVSSAGYEVLLVVTDAAGNSNQRMWEVGVAEMPRPDIFVVDLIFSDENPIEDDTIQMTALVKLQGQNISQEFEVAFYLDNLETQIGAILIENMTKGDEGIVNVSLPWKAVSGTHTIFAVADSTDVINEGSQGNKNNEFAQDIKVTAKDSSNDTSIILLILVVVISIGAVGYIYKDSLFGN